MLDGRRQKDRKSPGHFEIRGNIDTRNKPQRNEGSTRIPNLIVGLAKVNTSTRIPKKVNSRSSPPVVSSSLCTPKKAEITPEILIRAQAKTLEAINKINIRVDKLEHRIEDIYRKVAQLDRFTNLNKGKGDGGISEIKKNESSFSSGITPNTLSDVSDDDYSRTTNRIGQDGDELLSLLNQITKFFDSVKQTQPNCNPSTIPRSATYQNLSTPPPHLPLHPLPHNQLVAQTSSMAFGLTGHATSTASSSLKQSILNGIRQHHQKSPTSAVRKNLFSSIDHSRQIDCPDSTSSVSQSFRALIFESNVEHFLANLDFVPEPVRTNGYYYPPSIPTTALLPPNQRQHHQLVKSEPIIGSRLATETLLHPHKQPNQRYKFK